jgi:hypothetical protein
MSLSEWIDHWLSQAPMPSQDQYEDLVQRLNPNGDD